MNTILVLTDFSVRAQSAAEFALQIALNIEADIVLFHAVEVMEIDPVVEPMPWPIGDHITLKQEALADLSALKLHLEESNTAHGESSFKPSITCVSDFGKLTKLVSDSVNQNNIDMVVMGSHKSNSFARLISDSHTHEILDTINCPVLLVPEGFRLKDGCTISYGTDLSFNDVKVLDYLAEIAASLKSGIEVMHISSKGVSIKPEKYAAAVSQLKLKLKIEFKSIRSDNVPRSLSEITGRSRTHILALVHKRYSFFDRLFQTSVSKKLADTTQIPLLIIPHSFSVDVADISNEQLDHYCYVRSDSR